MRHANTASPYRPRTRTTDTAAQAFMQARSPASRCARLPKFQRLSLARLHAMRARSGERLPSADDLAYRSGTVIGGCRPWGGLEQRTPGPEFPTAVLAQRPETRNLGIGIQARQRECYRFFSAFRLKCLAWTISKRTPFR